MNLKLVTGPTDEPIGLTEAKAHLRIDHSTEDVYINGLIKAARDLVQNESLHALLTQTWALYLDAWPGGNFLELPMPPLQSVSSITYKTEDGSTETLSTDVYFADTNRTPGAVALKPDQEWPSDTLYPYGAICITFVCGWTAARDIPQEAIHALKLALSDFYEHRETIVIGQQANQVSPFRNLLWDLRAQGITW